MPSRTTFPLLHKRTSGGDHQLWQVWVEKTRNGGRICRMYGLEGGKQTTAKEEIIEGKNRGKANETSPYEQVVLQAEALWKKQRDRNGYGESFDASEAKRKLSPMLAHPFDKHSSKVNWDTASAEPKLNGHRCLAYFDTTTGQVHLQSRRGTPITHVPHIADELVEAFGYVPPGTILDGELYCHDLALNKISSAVRRKKEQADHAERIGYHLYDLFSDEPYSARYTELEKIVRCTNPKHIHVVRNVIVRSSDELAVCERSFLEDGYEGAILRHGNQGYEPGRRTEYLLKVKRFVDREFKIIDVRRGRGKYEDMAIFICETDAGHAFEVTSPGTHEDKKRAWKERDGYIGTRLKVKFESFTATSEPVPYMPVAIEIRASGD